MNPGDHLEAPESDPRFGNGVPAHLKPRGLAFIEMTGVSRSGISRATPSIQADTSLTRGHELHPGEPSASALFQDLLRALQGDEQPAAPTLPPVERPAGAVQALAQVESLFHALNRLEQR